MTDYYYVCKNPKCNHLVTNAASDLILLAFKRKDRHRCYLFRRCPLCNYADSRIIAWSELATWKAQGALVFHYSLDDTSSEFISKLMFFPSELTPLHCDLAAVTVLDDAAFERALYEYIFPKGSAQNP